MNIPIILGTAREGRQSEKAANYMFGQVQTLEGVETELIDVRDYRIVASKEETAATKAYTEKIAKADGLIIVSPEYNHGYPGELKMMIAIAYQEYGRKPVGLCGVSMSPMGGVRAVEQLRGVFAELHMVDIREALYFSSVGELFDEEGNITDESYEERVKTFLDELVWYAKALKTAREAQG